MGKKSKRKRRDQRRVAAIDAPGTGARYEVPIDAEPPPRKTPIFIGIPAMDGVVGIGAQNLIAAAIEANHLPTCPWTFTWQILNDHQPIEWARNCLCRHFLEQTSAELMFMMDSDIIPPTNVMNLFGVDADVAVGQALVFEHARGARPTSIKMVAFDYRGEPYFDFVPIVPEIGQRVVDVDACGTGAILIRRHVVEDPWMHLPGEYIGLDDRIHSLTADSYDEQWAPAVFRTLRRANGQRLRGEDLDFSHRAKQRGYSVRCDLRIRFGHYKSVDLNEVVDMTDRVAQAWAAHRNEETRDAGEGEVEDQAKSPAA